MPRHQMPASGPNELSTKLLEGRVGPNDVSGNGAGTEGGERRGGDGSTAGTLGVGYGIPTSLYVEPRDS